MINFIKKAIKDSFKLLNLDIRRIPEYEKNKFVWLKDLNINTVIDIGANIGQFTLELSKFIPNVRIFAFEPLKDVYAELLKNLAKSKNIKDFKAFNIALGSFNGVTKIYRSKFSPSSSLLEMADLHKEAFPFTKEIYEEEIFVKKLDDVMANEIMEPEILIKLDVQGYENEVLQGGINTFKKAKVVIVEVSFYELYKGQALFDKIYDQFRDLEFEYKGSINASFHPKNGLPLFSDAIFVKRN